MIRSSGERSTSSSAWSKAAGSRRAGLGRDVFAPRRCRGSRRSCRRRRSPLRRSSTTERASSLRLRARWPVKPRRAASALISGISPSSSSSSRRMRVSGWPADFGDVDAEQLGELGRERDQPQLLVGGPFVARRRRPRLRSSPPSSEPSRGPAAARTVQPSSDKAISSPSGVARTHSSMSWSADAATAGRDDRRCRACARAARPPRPAAAPASGRAPSRPRAAALRARGRRRSAGRPCRRGRGPRAVQRARWPCPAPKAASAAR